MLPPALSRLDHIQAPSFAFKSADLFQSVERVGIQAIIPTYPAKPAKPGQAGQPARPAGHRSLGPPGIDVSNLLSIGAPARLLRPPQAATGGQLSGSTAPGGAAKHATNHSNIDDMTNFPSNRVMGRPFHGFRVPIKIL